MTASLHRLLHGLNIRDLTKLRRRRERKRERELERQTSNSFNEQNNSARAWRFFTNSFAVSAQQGREMANFFKCTWEQVRQGDKFYRARSPLLPKFPSFK